MVQSRTYPSPQLLIQGSLAPQAGGVEECWGTHLGKGFPLAFLRSLSLSGGDKMSWGRVKGTGFNEHRGEWRREVVGG